MITPMPIYDDHGAPVCHIDCPLWQQHKADTFWRRRCLLHPPQQPGDLCTPMVQREDAAVAAEPQPEQEQTGEPEPADPEVGNVYEL